MRTRPKITSALVGLTIIAMVMTSIRPLKAQRSELANKQANTDQQSREEIEAAFDKRMEDYRDRITRIERQLDQLKRKFQKEMQNREATIDQLLRKDVPSQAEGLPAEVIASQAWTVWRRRNYPEAYKLFTKALEKDPSLTESRNGLAWSMLHMRMYDKAAEEFDKVLEVKPDHGGALNGLGQIKLAQGKYELAVQEFENAVEDVIDKVGEKKAARMKMAAWVGLVRALEASGKTDQAIDWADRLLKENEDDDLVKKLRESLND
ncbi:MAG: tetratricopeptide repeat protein [Planctomycetota bacterium]